MKGRHRLLVLLSIVILISGCQPRENDSSNESPIESTARSVVQAYQKYGEHLVDHAVVDFIDFTALQNLNPEIYAWLLIPGTSINAPITQSQSGDITFYQSHGPDLSENERGSLYTHFRYSTGQFSERVSVVYGKTLSSASVLDGIESLYHSIDAIRQHQDLYIFTKTAVLHYSVFCSTDFSDVLLSSEYNAFRDTADTASFLDDVRTYRTLRRQIDDAVSVTPENRMIVLTSRLEQNENKRFLVLAKLVDTTN